MDTVTRASLAEALWREVGLPRAEAERIVEAVIEELTERLAAGEKVKITNLGTFSVRVKGRRMGRNPKTGTPAPVAARQVVAFRPSRALKTGVNARMSGAAGET